MNVVSIGFFIYFNISLIIVFSLLAQENRNVILDDLRCRISLKPQGLDYTLVGFKVRTNRKAISKNGNKLKSCYPLSKSGFDEIAKVPLQIIENQDIAL